MRIFLSILAACFLKLWDLTGALKHGMTKALAKELGTPRGGQFKDWIHAIAIAPNARWVAAADMAGRVQLWAVPPK